MGRNFEVRLAGVPVGFLVEEDSGTSFALTREYRALPVRPVVGQRFEDDLTKVYKGSKDRLPPFFDNLVPEGVLRNVLSATFSIPSHDDLGLLSAVGSDLPGAIELVPAEGEALIEETGDSLLEPGIEPPEQLGLRFSLAGVQLKFSVLRDHERMWLPAHGERGLWIVKFGSAEYPGLVRNEATTLAWAREAGFEVPAFEVQPVSALPENLRDVAGRLQEVLVIKRYDRDGQANKIHQEDFAQVLGKYSEHKYNVTYNQLGAVVAGVLGESGFLEYVRRLVFVILSGNCDAHLKNWSLVYPDGIEARLAPVYDQVATRMWPHLIQRLPMNLSNSAHFAAIRLATFQRLAKDAGQDPEKTVELVIEASAAIQNAYYSPSLQSEFDEEYRSTVASHWKKLGGFEPFAV